MGPKGEARVGMVRAFVSRRGSHTRVKMQGGGDLSHQERKRSISRQAASSQKKVLRYQILR